MASERPSIAYFSMEVALTSEIPNYAGGLGVLAADLLMALADMDYPAVGVSLIYHQDDDPDKAFHPEAFMERLDTVVEVPIEDRQVKVGVYRYEVKGIEERWFRCIF